MQPGNNAIRPTSGNGVWITSNNGSPEQGQQIFYNNVEKSVFRKTSRRRLERLLIMAVIIIFILLLALSVALYFVVEYGEKNSICFTPDCIKAAATLLHSMDSAVNPCDNFYDFACGNWRKVHPPDEPVFINNWFQESFKIQIRDSIDYLERNDSETEPHSVRAARLVYRTCLDFESMEQTGLDALWALLEILGLPRNPLTQRNLIQPWVRTIAKARRYLSMDLLVGTSVLASLQNSSRNQLVVSAPEDNQLLPGTTKWRWEDKSQREQLKRIVRDEGEQLVTGWKKYATRIIEYVIKAADNSTDVTENELNDAAYSLLDIQREILLLEDDESVKASLANAFPDVYTLAELQYSVDNASNSGISKLRWKEFFEAIYEDIDTNRMEFREEEPIMVRSVPYLQLMSKLVEDMEDKAIEFFIWWNVIYAVAPHVNEDMKQLKEVFVKKILQVPPADSRNIVCMQTVSLLMKSAVGYQVMEYANEQTISQVKDMLRNVRGSFANFIFALDWMDDTTKYATVEKLYKMNMYVGYPDWYNNKEIMDTLYSNVTLSNGTHLLNVLFLLDEEVFSEFAALDYINNSSRDFFDPLDINAYYDPSSNSITVPYGILQQPYYNMGLEALNYGAIGTILGHEITHGLDNTGRMYDKFGNYKVWWSNFSSEEYLKRETCYEEAYSNFYLKSIDSMVNGAVTLGENIADDGGVRDSLAAYRSYVKKHGREAKLPGLLNYTHDQLFFLSFANVWCSEYSNDALVRTLEDDEHSPNFVRVLVVLQNFRDFSESWNCPKGSYMNPEQKCKLWE